ncbi:hypothetical protein B9Z55_017840 [Caenorhabditis nigoni]|uniref:DUF38 domain-containing protein n=1 Tax=Caenorhabditis nigoni TaxID=1611254 RepID=A0A2G5TBR2_9PELO|nr:hypothetical protein B9Z55_017840 [Caenorhabditis nigoni]
MSHAYQWLTDRQRKNISRIIFTFSNKHIYLFLHCLSKEGMRHIHISYESFGDTTSVTSEKNDLTVDKNNVDVFCEDIAMIIRNQESILETFQATFGTMGYCGGEPISDTTVQRIFASIEDALKSRSSLLKTESLSISFASVFQSISMIRYLDPGALKSVVFSFADLVDCKDFTSFKELKDHYQIILFLRFDTVTLENIHCFNENRFIPQKSVMVERTVNKTLESQTETREVLENPLTMKLILKELDCFDFQKLRKVSSGIRYCVDNLKPDSNVKSLAICLEQHVHSTLIELTSEAHKEIKYFPANTVGCVNKHHFIGLDARTQSLKDAETILKNQKMCMEELRLVYQCFLVYLLESKDILSGNSEIFSVAFGEILRRRTAPLKTQRFAISCKHQKEVMAILPYIDPGSLKILEILFPSKQEYLKFDSSVTVKFDVKFEVDQISETEQWRKAEQLLSNYLIITTPIQQMSIVHFVNLEILVECLSSEDVFFLKTNLLGKPKFQKFRISFLASTIDEFLNELIGEPYRIVPNIKKIWYFRIPHTEYYMHISLDIHNLIYISPQLEPYCQQCDQDLVELSLANIELNYMLLQTSLYHAGNKCHGKVLGPCKKLMQTGAGHLHDYYSDLTLFKVSQCSLRVSYQFFAIHHLLSDSVALQRKIDFSALYLNFVPNILLRNVPRLSMVNGPTKK